MHPETGTNSANFIFLNRTRDTPLRGVYIPHFDQISVKKFSFGVLFPNRCTGGVKFGMEEGRH